MSALRSSTSIGGRTLSLSNLEKVLFPYDGFTKGDIIAYYTTNAPIILPHLHDRPLTLQRYPNGIDAPSFFEKHLPKGVPDWVERASISHAQSDRDATTFMLCNDAATLAYIANLAAIVLHVWTSRSATIDEPDFIFFDLDPGDECTLRTLTTVALELRDILGSIGITALVKSSGGLGLHVVVPLAAGYTYDDARLFAQLIAHRMADSNPKKITLQRALARRDQRAVYFDYVQVGRGKTIACAYSIRARDGAPISTPLLWSEVEALSRKRTGTPSDAFAAYTIRNIGDRIGRLGDLWAGKAWKKQRLEPALAKARRVWGIL